MPRAARTYHLAGEEVVLVDKDNAMSSSFTPPVDELAERTAARADEYLHFVWWMLSDVAKYLQRRSWYEAVERLGVVRDYTLRLVAIGARTRFPEYGLISLIDFAPDAIPPTLRDIYPSPSEPTATVYAALTLADLLEGATVDASTVVGRELSTGWAKTARERLLASAAAVRDSRRPRPGDRGSPGERHVGFLSDIVRIELGVSILEGELIAQQAEAAGLRVQLLRNEHPETGAALPSALVPCLSPLETRQRCGELLAEHGY